MNYDLPGSLQFGVAGPYRVAVQELCLGNPRFPLKGSFKGDTAMGRGVDIESGLLLRSLSKLPSYGYIVNNMKYCN